MNTSGIRVTLLVLGAAALGGCMSPNPYVQAPVVDHSVFRNQKSSKPAHPPVQVTPLKPSGSFNAQPIGPEAPPGQSNQAGQSATNAAQTAGGSASSGSSGSGGGSNSAAASSSSGGENKAVVALLDNAANSVGSGNLEKAAASLERALRIEPGNPTIWHDLGQIRLHQGKYSQAEAMFDKSNSLAGNNTSLMAQNWRMIAAARRAAGDQSGATAATAKATQLEQQ